jgi:hypothetical protein
MTQQTRGRDATGPPWYGAQRAALLPRRAQTRGCTLALSSVIMESILENAPLELVAPISAACSICPSGTASLVKEKCPFPDAPSLMPLRLCPFADAPSLAAATENNAAPATRRGGCA